MLDHASRRFLGAGCLAAALALAGCAPSLAPDHRPDGGGGAGGGGGGSGPGPGPGDGGGGDGMSGDGGGGGSGGPHVTHTALAGGVTRTRVDAQDNAAWVHLDFESRREAPADPPTWELAFQRFHVIVDGGVSGGGNVAVATLGGADFAALTQAPPSGYVSDSDGSSGRVFESNGGWYDYDANSHVLTPRKLVYVVRSAEGHYFMLRFTSYYDDAGTPAHPTFEWAPLAAPATGGTP